MHNVDILLVAAFRAFATASPRHQFGSRARWPELDYFTQRSLSQASLLRFLRSATLDLCECPESQAVEPDKALGIRLAIVTRLLKTCHGGIV